MAELKRNFLDGKMNKDADERLVPDGQYRDALNIEISTSESNNKGVVQTLNGNVELPPMTTAAATTISADATTVGNVVDQSNGLVYNFVCNASSLVNGIGVISDAIVELKPKSDYSNAAATNLEFTPVFTDVYESRYTPVTFSTPLVTGLPTSIVSVNTALGTEEVTPGVYRGMKVQFISSSGVDFWSGSDVRVIGQLPNGDVSLTPIPSPYSPAQGKLVFTKQRILNFKSGTSELESNVGDGTGSSKTPNGNIITGINIVEDFLLFTDGISEPKKINIKRSKLGTVSISEHTKLFIKVDNSLVPAAGKGNLVVLQDVTVIRPNPNSAPTIEATQNNISTGPLSVAVVGNANPQAAYGSFALSSANNALYAPGVAFYIQTQTATNYALGSTITLTGQTSAAQATVIVDDTYSNSKYRVLFQSVSEGYDGTEVDEVWVSSEAKLNTFYNETFVSFAYRYVYTDGEVSCISPYSSPAFIPGIYSYSPKTGFNLGMQNIVDLIVVKDFVPTDIPRDVVEVELLLRTTDNENIYLFRSVKKGSPDFVAQGTGTNKGYISITQEQAGSTLPSSQALRSFDAVPIAAIAQEFSAGRLIYGNYTQDYDLLDGAGQFIKPRIDIGSQSINANFGSVVISDNNFEAFRSLPGRWEDLQGGGSNPIGNISFSQDNWRQVSRQIATNASSPYTDDTNYKWATKRGLYVGADSLTQTGNAFKLFGPPDQALPYRYYYEPPVSGEYKWRIAVVNVLDGTSFPTDPDGPANSVFDWRVAIYECDDNGEMANIDGTVYSTSPTPLFYSAPTKGITGTYQAGQNNTFEFDPLDVTATVTLELGKKYQVFIVQNRKPSGLNANGTRTDFVTDGLTDSNIANDGEQYGVNPQLYAASVSVTESPGTTETLASLTGRKSVKSERPYQAGIVYRDKYGRESSVLVDEKNNFSTAKSSSASSNRITTVINNNAPYWADSYKFFIKETTEKYYNLVMNTALSNNDGVFAWLVFNSSDRNKVKIGDILSLKKSHGTSVPVTSTDAQWKIVDIQNEGSVTDDGGELSVGGTTILDSVVDSAADIIGKFFVKVNLNSAFTTYVGTIDNIASLGVSNPNGAVFETVSEQQLDLDLYYEVGSSYPIKLTTTSAEQYIPVGSKISVTDFWFQESLGDTFNNVSFLEGIVNEQFNANFVGAVVQSVSGATSFPSNIESTTQDSALCIIKMNNNGNFNNTPTELAEALGNTSSLTELNAGWVITFERPDGSVVTGQAIGPIASGIIKIRPYTHPTASFPSVKSKMLLPWYNSIAFGNGVESDTIRDDFNASELYKYVATGKQSGFKANLPAQDYKQTLEQNQLIYSQIYNEDAGVNRLNQFLAAENIVKKVNPENGSIQKLFSRDTNLVIFCESKVFGGPINKDIIFNADGNGQLITSNKVIGTLTPYSGDYGISTNPESFASDEFRIYFADKDQGAVLRLSRDGITPIHEYGMEDWFNDNLKSAQALVGSFDDKKGEYNLTVHNVTNPGWKKDVYTLSFDEAAKGWVCFKSFIPEQGFSLNNQFFTFKNGDLYLHHYSEVNRNKFYGVDNNSSVTSIFNDAAGTVKSFNALSYEGTQARIITDDGDGEYFNEFNNSTVAGVNLTERGWYAEYVNTDQQEGQVDIFVEKEGKWFNYIKGVATNYTNASDGVQTANNLDTHEFSVQGIGQLSDDATLVSGVAPTDAYALTFVNNTYAGFAGDWNTTGISLYGVTALSGATANTFVINPSPGFVLDASLFSNNATDSLYSAVTFANSGVANTPSNTVIATVTWVNQTISADDSIVFQIQSTVPFLNGVNFESQILVVNTGGYPLTPPANVDISFISGVAGIQQLEGSTTNWTTNANIPANEEVILTKVRISPSAGYFAPNNVTSLANSTYVVNGNFEEGESTLQAFMTLSEFTSIDSNGIVEYTELTLRCTSSEDVELVDSYAILISVNPVQPITTEWLVGETVVDDAVTSTILNFTNYGEAPSFTIEAGQPWLVSVTANNSIDGSPVGSATVITTANTGAAREADLSIYSSNDPTQASPSTLVFKQNALDTIQLYRANTTTGQLISNSSFNVSAAATNRALMVSTNAVVSGTSQPLAPVSGDFTFNYGAGPSGWLTVQGIEIASDQQNVSEGIPTNYWVYFTPTFNATVTVRSVIITATHADGSVTDTFTITQQGVYDAATDTVIFCDAAGNETANINVPYTYTIGTGYLKQLPAGGIPIVDSLYDVATIGPSSNEDDLTFSNQITNVTAVAGQPYTHTYQYTVPINNLTASKLVTAAVFYTGSSNYASNQTNVPDDQITFTQAPSPFAWFIENFTDLEVYPLFANDTQPTSTPTASVATNMANSVMAIQNFVNGFQYSFNPAAVLATNGINYSNTAAGTLFNFVGIYASTGYSLKYIEGTTASYNFGFEGGYIVNDFTVSSKPSWITDVALSTTSSGNNFADGAIKFKISPNTTGGLIRLFVIGMFLSGATSPARVIEIKQSGASA